MAAASTAGVGFDATDQKFVVINGDNLEETDNIGDSIDLDGRSLTLLEICQSVEEAKMACEQKALNMSNINGMGLASITFDDEPQSSSSGTEAKDDEEEMIDEMMDDGEIVNGTNEDDTNAHEQLLAQINNVDLDVIADLQGQLDSMKKSVREVVGLVMSDIQSDMTRIEQKQKKMMDLFQKVFGTERDGRIIEPFSEQASSRTFNFGSLSDSRSVDPIIQSQMDIYEQSMRRTIDHNLRFIKSQSSNSIANGTANRGVPTQAKPSWTRTYDESTSSYGVETSTPSNSKEVQGKRIVNGIVQPVDRLDYPYISREEEERCLEEANGQGPIYAQLISKVLFADTIDLYFKDQDVGKRNWLHDAVDYRFPTFDKSVHVAKWKNCSYFINKNMRQHHQMTGRPQPRAYKERVKRDPIASIYEPDEQMKQKKENQQKNEMDEEEGGEQGQQQQNDNSRVPMIKYLTAEYEQECYDEAQKNGNQYKYAELMAFRLFADNLLAKFKEQDVNKKEWLRHCVESRYPITNRENNDKRWKVCGQTCNRNRTKVVGPDGNEAKWPYFAQSVEEECFRKCDGNVALYAELMNEKLFPDTQHVYFKNQDMGKRFWLHTQVDRRFPTPDKAMQFAKWKSCTTAINKKFADGTVIPIQPPEPQLQNYREESTAESDDIDEETTLVEEEDEEETETKPIITQTTPTVLLQQTTPTVPLTPANIPKFDRKSIDHSLKRKWNDSSDSGAGGQPSVKRESARNKMRKEKEEYESYPYISEEDEIKCLMFAKGNANVYGREILKILFKDSTPAAYYKETESKRREWFQEILDFRFPSENEKDQTTKLRGVMLGYNKYIGSITRRSQ